MRTLLALTAAIGLLSITGVAAAQDKVESKNDKLETWIFPDDQLLNVKPYNGDAKIMAGPKVVRTILSRPRTQFVPELLKTIESL